MSFRTLAPLPDDVVDRLFSALVVRYGAAFTDRWRDLDLAVVKTDWSRQLAGFSNASMRYALDHLPEKAPTVIDFRKLCNGAPTAQVQPMLTSDARVRGPTPAEREQLRALAQEIRRGSLFARPGTHWATELLECHAAGWRHGKPFRSTPLALAMAREALGIRAHADVEDDFEFREAA